MEHAGVSLAELSKERILCRRGLCRENRTDDLSRVSEELSPRLLIILHYFRQCEWQNRRFRVYFSRKGFSPRILIHCMCWQEKVFYGKGRKDTDLYR